VPIVLTPLADVTGAEDELVDILIPADTFADVDGDRLTLTATLVDGGALPEWLRWRARG
jgi:hypothetical protein